MTYEEAINSKYAKEYCGIYYIYQIKNDNIHPYYIGKASDNFYSRLQPHRSDGKCFRYTDKCVQLGTLHVEERINTPTFKEILNDMESILIFTINNRFDLSKNTSKTNTINLWADYMIYNEGNLPIGVGKIMKANKGKYTI